MAALGIGPKDFLNDLNTFGLFFETMAVRDLRVFADPWKVDNNNKITDMTTGSDTAGGGRAAESWGWGWA